MGKSGGDRISEILALVLCISFPFLYHFKKLVKDGLRALGLIPYIGESLDCFKFPAQEETNFHITSLLLHR